MHNKIINNLIFIDFLILFFFKMLDIKYVKKLIFYYDNLLNFIKFYILVNFLLLSYIYKIIILEKFLRLICHSDLEMEINLMCGEFIWLMIN